MKNTAAVCKAAVSLSRCQAIKQSLAMTAAATAAAADSLSSLVRSVRAQSMSLIVTVAADSDTINRGVKIIIIRLVLLGELCTVQSIDSCVASVQLMLSVDEWEARTVLGRRRLSSACWHKRRWENSFYRQATMRVKHFNTTRLSYDFG